MLLIGRQGGSDTLIPVKGSIEINKAESNLTSTIILGKASEASLCGNLFLKGLGKNDQPQQPQAKITPPPLPPQRFRPRTTRFNIKIAPPKKKDDTNQPNTNDKEPDDPEKPP